MEESEAYIKQLENELARTNNQANQQTQALISNSMYGSTGTDQNLIVYQLEFDNILDRIEHQLKGDIIETDKDGNQYYTAPTKKIIKNGKEIKVVDEDLQTLNDYGANLIMNTINSYLNRNTVLSNYDEDRIYQILYDLATKLRVLIYCNYEKMGLTTDSKRARYGSIVLSIIHQIESSYRRALNGEESKGLRTARVVTQNDPLMNHAMPQIGSSRGNKFNIMKPKTWI